VTQKVNIGIINKVQGSRFKVQGSRFKVQGSRLKVQWVGFLILTISRNENGTVYSHR
jgi:hypothetical protein